MFSYFLLKKGWAAAKKISCLKKTKSRSAKMHDVWILKLSRKLKLSLNYVVFAFLCYLVHIYCHEINIVSVFLLYAFFLVSK